jgi:hypothetical protein
MKRMPPDNPFGNERAQALMPELRRFLSVK